MKVTVERLSASYGETPALQDVSFTVGGGEWVALVLRAPRAS